MPEPYTADLTEPRLPERPAGIRDKLRPELATRQYTVWFGTNRAPLDPHDVSKGFSSRRDDQLHYGTCKVAIPKSHLFGSVSSAWWKRWPRFTDGRLKIVTRTGLSPDDFWIDISAGLNEVDPGERHGLVFLHGYNVDFDEAAIRAAQIGYDLKVPGVTAFFSWPSCGTLSGYTADEACIEASERFILEFLRDFVRRSGAERVHIIAHSMGNRGLLRALSRLAADAADQTGIRFGQIILSAPDIDADVFADLARVYAKLGQRTTLYASPADRAIAVSRFVHGYHRAGLTPPVTVVPGVDTIDIPSFDLFNLLGHGYYAEAAGPLHDMFDLIRRNAPPADRQRLSAAMTPEGMGYWVMDM